MAKKKVEDTTEDTMEGSEDSLDVIELDTNLDEVPEPELLPPGWYVGEVQSVEKRWNSKGTGEYFSVRFVIPTTNFPPDYDVENWPDGLSVYYNLLRVPSPGDRRSAHNIRKFIEALGLPTDVPRIDPNEWIGREAKLKVEHNTYEGNTREGIARNGIQAV